ncbi:hypothetical protein I7I50_09735 [Histoplasma capsulatum G186AR]|uniref:Secreted protein n=1 Tax=Ajellomyces capsulatus TaxID=5037 RepID=A0A8H7YSS0_AJECA|nr:hypothetical protein I7I52_07266 [Histoplasma capsulatum]QSS74514.1 hypothetical protein I7I50_09735 [Histoplasma capsulatum G186AR]
MTIHILLQFIMSIIFNIITQEILSAATISSTIDKKIYDINNIIKDIKADIEIYQKTNNIQDLTLSSEDEDFNDFIISKLNLLQSINKPDMILTSRAWYCDQIPCMNTQDCSTQPGVRLNCHGCNTSRGNWGYCMD